MKKVLGIFLSASLAVTLAGCMGTQEPPVTEETLPLPLWAVEEEKRPTVSETTPEEERISLPEETETIEEATISQRPEKYPTEATEPEESSEASAETTETELTEAPTVSSDYQMEEKFEAVSPETVYAKKSVRMRSQGNVNSDDLGRLGEGKTVTRIGISADGWSAVIYEDELRYIASEYLTTDEHAEPPENPNVPKEIEVDDTVYTVDDVNMREGPGFDRAVLCRVPEFVELHRTGIVTSGWCKVTYKDQEGYINTGYLSEKHAGQSENAVVEEEETDDTVYTTREVNFRKGPGIKQAIIGRIPEGTEVKRIAIADNGWCKVTYEGKTGYISGDYVSHEIPSEG